MKKNFRFQLLVLFFLLIQIPQKSNAQQTRESLSEFFNDLLLIINFNHPYYANIEFLKEIYGPYFPNIVFYGEVEHPEVIKIEHNLGWFVHRTVKDAMIRFPNFRGYLCCQDDCFMNFWNFTRLDKDKIWFHTYWKQSFFKENPLWPWWNIPCGYTAAAQSYKKLPTKNILTLRKNCGSYSTVAYSWADFFYIPGKYRDEFIQASQCFENPDVFIEIAIPTLVLSLEEFDRMEHLNPFWGGTIDSINFDKYDIEYDWVHPIKFSVEENRQFVRNILSIAQ